MTLLQLLPGALWLPSGAMWSTCLAPGRGRLLVESGGFFYGNIADTPQWKLCLHIPEAKVGNQLCQVMS